MEEYFLILVNNDGEQRLVRGSTLARIQPMVDIGFYLPIQIDIPDISWEEAINRSLIFHIDEELVGELLCWDDFFNSFKTMENIYKGIFEPVEVRELYLAQKSYWCQET